MKVLFYGKLASTMGRELDVQVETPCTVAALRRQLVALRPEAAESFADRRVRAFVGSGVVADDYCVAPGDEVEFLAPVSGG